MSAELIAILAVGVALGTAMLATMRGLRSEMTDLRADVRDVRSEVRDVRSDVGELRERMTRLESELRERMARLEGLFEGVAGLNRQENPPPVRREDSA